MEGQHHLGIFVLGLGSLLMPPGVSAGPFFPLSVPVSHNYGYVNLDQYPPVQTLPSDFLEIKSPFRPAPGSPLCLSESCILNAADLLKQMDRKVDPCQDFYKFACGGFIADTVLPEHKTRTGFSLGCLHGSNNNNNRSRFLQRSWWSAKPAPEKSFRNRSRGSRTTDLQRYTYPLRALNQ